jgi:predicted ATPase
VESLKEYLSGKQMLLVLDNFEQVVEAGPVVPALLKSGPGLKALVTSRVGLKVYGEREYSVPSLSLPPVGAAHTGPLTLERLTQYEAVRLFIERAQAAKPDFVITNENAPSVAEICHRLDGLPLAIELAAARVRLFPPQAMLAKLQSRLKLLTGGARDLPARQQTLRGAIEWSYELLDPGDQQLFRRLAVFQGGRTLEAVEAVCNAGGDLQADVVDGVESLMAKSLLQQREGRDGEHRLWMLETVHEYAREKLDESGEGEELRRQHAEYYVKLVEEIEPKLYESEAAIWFHKLEAEHDNIRAALAWATEQDIQVALRLLGAVWLFWETRGYYSEGRARLDAVLLRPEARATATPALARALYSAGYLATRQGDLAIAFRYYEEALSAKKALDDKAGVALILKELGTVVGGQGDYSKAHTYFNEGLTIAREFGDRWLVSRLLNDTGEVLRSEGRFEEAGRVYEEALEIRRDLGNLWSVSGNLHNLGFVVHRQGDYQRAFDMFKEGMVLAQEFERPFIIAGCLAGIGGVAWSLGQPEKAARLLGAGKATLEAFGGFMWPPDQEEFDRFVAGTRAELDEATWQKAYEEGRAMPTDKAIAYALEAPEGEGSTKPPTE